MTVEYIWIQGENGSTMMAKQPEADPKGLFGDKGMTFKDALDIINPLQQLPIIGSIYRAVTGDTISQGARLIGGTIYGVGVLGAIGAAATNAYEDTTGHDPATSAMAMINGQSLGDQIQTAQAARDKSAKQLASAQYTNGGADPIDPTSLPPGAKMVDVAAPADPTRQLASAPAAVPPTQTAAATTPAAAPANAVSVSALPPLPPTISSAGNQTGNQTPGNRTGNQTGPAANRFGGATASDAGSASAMPTTPAGITGLSALSHLPTAGSITPPGAALVAAQTQTSLTPQSNGPNIPLPIVAPKAAAGATAAAPAPGLALTKAPESFPVPARTNNVMPRMPVVQNPANVGTQPLALSNVDHRSINVVPPSTPTTAVTPAASIQTAGPAAAATPLAPLPPAQIPDAMARALDKYDALMRSRRGSNGQVDQSL